jgi:2-C-methyl-D-erythritol 4-phosphate cytidylyltransferase
MNVTTAPNEIVWTIVVAAGSGARFGGPKQFSMLGDRRVLDWSVETAGSSSAGVVVVLPAADAEREGGVAGGETRSESVRCGLAAVPADATIICVHDAARPFASAHLYREVILQVHAGADGAIPALPVTDTIKQVNSQNIVVATPDRSSLVAVQTPQAFRASVLRSAHASSPEGTDDATLVEAMGKQVVVVAGETMNRKLTAPEDLEWARAMAHTEA